MMGELMWLICPFVFVLFFVVVGYMFRKVVSRRTMIGIFLLSLVAVASLVVYVLGSAKILGMGVGDIADAERWRTRLTPLADPVAAQRLYPEIEVMNFENGEWVFGISTSSHGSHWGGTVVVKDSRGRVRAFFGHVCGPMFLSRMQGAKSLIEFFGHDEWKLWEMREHTFE